MSNAWRKQQGQDKFFRLAKQQGYRARSAYKLIEILQKYPLVKRGMVVLDLGAAPGSWSQVVAELVHPTGRVVAVDLQEIHPIAGVHTIQADLRNDAVLDMVADAVGGGANLVMSDLAPQATGIPFVDHARSIELATRALEIARLLSKPGSGFITKVLRGEDFDALLKKVRAAYRDVHVVIPEATRAESREVYVVGRNLKAPVASRTPASPPSP